MWHGRPAHAHRQDADAASAACGRCCKRRDTIVLELMRLPSVCFIVGAGFSCAYSEQAPTMARFLEGARDRGIFDPKGEHRILAEVTEKYFGSPTAPNIEDLATFLLADFGLDPLRKKEQRLLAYEQLIEIISKTLAFAHSKPRSSATKDLFTQFAAFILKNEINIISFNCDLILDQLLRRTGEWLPIDGYGVQIPLALPGFSRGAMRRMEDVGRQGRNIGAGPISKMALLKLHGSLNWGVRQNSKCADDGEVTLSISGAIPFGRDEQGSDYVGSIENSSMNRRFGRSGFVEYYWRPFIVPPDIGREEKGVGGRLMRDVWHIARGVLHSSTEIHVMGYSLPPSDFDADALIRDGIFGPRDADTERRLVVVNKDPAVVERFRGYARPEVVKVEASSRSDVIDHMSELMTSRDFQQHDDPQR